MCRNISAAARPSRSASLAAMAGARSAPAMCCMSARTLPPMRGDSCCSPCDCSRASRMRGTSACSTVRTARRIFSRRTTSTRSSPRIGRCTTTPIRTGVRLIGPKPGWARDGRRRSRAASEQHPRQRLRHRHDRFHRRHAGHPRPRRAVAWAASSAPSPSRKPSCGRWGSFAPATKSASFVSRRRRPRGVSRSKTRRSPRSTPVASPQIDAREARRRRLHRRLPRRNTGHAERRLPARGRCLSAGRIRPHRARFRAALPRSRADARGRQGHAVQGLTGIIDLTPGIRSLQIHYDAARARARRSDRRACSRSKTSSAICPTWRCRLAHRAPAAVVERRGDAARRSTNTCSRRARRCALVSVQHRVHPAHQRPRLHRRGEAHRLRRELSRARPGRRLSRRAGGDAGRSAPPPGHHEIQSGAHLDAGECRRHRRRLSLHLRHGRARRLSVLRAHLPDVEHLSRDRRVRARQAVAVALLRSDPVLSPSLARSFATFATGFSMASASRDRSGAFRLSATICLSRRQRREDRCLQDAPAGCFRGGAGALADDARGGEWRTATTMPTTSKPTGCCRQARRRSRARSPAACGRSWSSRARKSRKAKR